MADAETPHPLRPLLKNWVWEHGRVGTRYLDCSERRRSGSTTARRRVSRIARMFHVSLAA
jgi:hypothetical protein